MSKKFEVDLKTKINLVLGFKAEVVADTAEEAQQKAEEAADVIATFIRDIPPGITFTELNDIGDDVNLSSLMSFDSADVDLVEDEDRAVLASIDVKIATMGTRELD